MSSFTADLLVKVLSEERNGIGVFELTHPFTFDIGFLGSGESVTVPAGFRTDFCSIPRIARWLLPITGKAAKAGMVHDYLLVTNDPRATKAFAEALEVAGVGRFRRALMVTAVRIWTS